MCCPRLKKEGRSLIFIKPKIYKSYLSEATITIVNKSFVPESELKQT
jgi:hypothetical protein